MGNKTVTISIDSELLAEMKAVMDSEKVDNKSAWYENRLRVGFDKYKTSIKNQKEDPASEDNSSDIK